MSVGGRIEEIDNQVEKIKRLIERSAADDPEIGISYIGDGNIRNAENRIDQAMVMCEKVDLAIRDSQANRR